MKLTEKAFSLLLLAIFGCTSCRTPPAIEKAIDSYLSEQAKDGFSGSLAVACNGETVLLKGYGSADKSKGISYTPQTIATCGSITKQFTAAAILKLESQGKLTAHDLIARFFENVPDEKKSITLHHLLTHTAGLPEYSGRDFERITKDDLIKQVMEAPLAGEIGEFKYSNVGYSLLGIVIEKVSGKTIEAYFENELFAPASMNQTGYARSDWDSTKFAHAYRKDGSDRGVFRGAKRQIGEPYWHLKGNGGVQTTAEDMAMWYVALRNHTILPESAMKSYFGKHVKLPENHNMFSSDDNSYHGYSWIISETRAQEPLYWFGGTDDFFSAGILYYPEQDIFVYITSNHAGKPVTEFVVAVNNIISDGNAEGSAKAESEDQTTDSGGRTTTAKSKLDKAHLQKFTGTYSLSTGGEITIAPDNRFTGSLLIRELDQAAFLSLHGVRLNDKADEKRFDDAIEKIIRHNAKGDYQLFFEAQGGKSGELSYEEVQEKETKIWNEWRASVGELQNVQVLGTVLKSDVTLSCAKAEFERGTKFIYHARQNGKFITGVALGDNPPGLVFEPIPETEFKERFGDAILQFQLDENGKPESAIFEKDGVSIVVKRNL